MSEMIIQRESLVAIADAVRKATGETKLYTLDEIIKELTCMLPESMKQLMINFIERKNSYLKLPTGCTSMKQFIFNRYDNLTEVELPEGLTEIPKYAFQNSGLVKVNIPKSVKSIGNSAFFQCPLGEISFSEGLTSIGYNAFYNCKFEEITLPSTITSIDSAAFKGCGTWNDCIINVPWAEGAIANAPWGANSRTTINYNCPVIQEDEEQSQEQNRILLIDDETMVTIADIIRQRFNNTDNVSFSNILDSIPNVFIYEENGAAFFNLINDLTSVLDVPDGTTVIGNYALANYDMIQEINLPNGVTSIGDYAIYDCAALKSITIPESVTNIGTYALGDCPVLETINYAGTRAQWNEITFGKNWHYYYYGSNITVQCSDDVFGV